jgi:hypothetical protein
MQLGIELRNAISWFAHSLIAGHLGPDDSRYSRDFMFLKEPHIVGQAMAIFLYRLQLDEAGQVLNHEEAEQCVRQFIEWKNDSRRLPEQPFGNEELGIA